jgi:hypothetical protein
MKLRCSSLPLAFACPGSIRHAEGEVLIEIANEAAPLGSAVHEVLAEAIRKPSAEHLDVRPVALKHGVDADDLERLTAYGLHAWRALQQFYPDPVMEQPLVYETPAFRLTGHPDLLSVGPDWANVADWKTGYKQADHFHQLMGYAALCFAAYPQIVHVNATTVWLRDWSRETIRITVEDLLQWEEVLTARVVHWSGTYTAGPHCQFCPRFAACPARQALVRSAIAEATGEGLGTLMHADYPVDLRPAFAAFYTSGKLQLAKQLLDRLDSLIRAELLASGPLDLGNGRELAMVPDPRDTIDPQKAWPVISRILTDEEIAPCLRIGKTALLDTVAAKAPRGHKGKAKTALMEELKVAEAVSTKTHHKLTERKIEKEGT